MSLKNHSYPPIVFKKKYNKLVVNGIDSKKIPLRKIYPPGINQLINEQLKSLGAVLLKNRYFANRIVGGEQRQKNAETESRYVNGDYTNNQASIDYGSPIYATNTGSENTPLYITTEPQTSAMATDLFYNYQNFESSTSASRPVYAPSPVTSVGIPNLPSQMNTDFIPANIMNMASNSFTFGSANPSYGLPSHTNPMGQSNFGNSIGPIYSANPITSMGPISTMRPVYSAPNPEFSYSPPDAASTNMVGSDSMPYIIEDHAPCICKENLASTDEEGNLVDSDGADMSFTDSDMYDTILTTIAFMAFGTYFISMMMKINEKTPGATLMVVENDGNEENGRKVRNPTDEMYLNELMKQVKLFIDEFQELFVILEQR